MFSLETRKYITDRWFTQQSAVYALFKRYIPIDYTAKHHIYGWEASSGATGGLMKKESKKLIAAICAAAMLASTAVSNLPAVPVLAKTSTGQPAAGQETGTVTGSGADDYAASGTGEQDASEIQSSSGTDTTETTGQSGTPTIEGTEDAGTQSTDAGDADAKSVSGETGAAETEEQDAADDAESDTLTVHIRYQAAEGGKVSAEEEVAVLSRGGEKPVLSGVQASAFDGYQFTGWTLDGNTVSEDAAFVPEIDPGRYFGDGGVHTAATEITYTANFRKEEIKYPAVDFGKTSFADGSSVLVSAPEGAFPEGVRLTVSQVDTAAVLDAAKKASGDENLTESNIAAYDFDFHLDNTHGVEPLKDIMVTFRDMSIEGADQDQNLSLYHLQNNGSPAEAVDASAITSASVDDKTADVTFAASDFSMYLAVRRAPAADGPFWINEDTATRYTTLKQAVDAAADGAVIHMSGDIAAEAVANTAVGKNITLDAASDTTIRGTGKGITLESGSKLMTSGSAVLTMSGYVAALTVNEGARVTDGTYFFDQVQTGIDLKGALSGSDRSAMKVTVNAVKGSVGINTTGSDVKYSNVTLLWNGGRQDGWTYRNMNAVNSHIEIKDVWLYNSAANPLHLENSYFKISGRFNQDSWRGGHVLAVYEAGAEFKDSTVVVDGSRINVINRDGLTLTNSDVTVQNSPDGGFNINYGASLIVHDSTIKSVNVKKALIAAGYNNPSHLIIDGSSVIETEGTSSADSIGVDGNYYVTGGTYRLHEASLAGNDELIPTNGSANGNEKLTYFTLSDSAATQLQILNKNGEYYTYPVGKANEDGVKRVWAPQAEVVFRLNNSDAKFADSTSQEKSGKTIRGYSLRFVQGNADPGTPVSKDRFLGWYYKDKQGNEIPFTMDTAVNADTEVYAKWNNSFVVYHNGQGKSFLQSAGAGAKEAVVRDYAELAGEDSGFFVEGKTFEYWTTAEDGSGKHYQKGDKIAFAEGQTQIDLYANYRKEQYTVSFSANGGTFSEGSVYKDPKYFDLHTDKYGGEVAVLKQTAVYGQKLHDLTQALGLDYNLLKPDTAAKLSWNQLEDTANWGTTAFGGTRIRFDDYKLWFFTVNGENPTITDNVTYYLQWKPDAKKSGLSGSFVLQGDLWHEGISKPSKATTISKSVKTGDAVSLTAGVDVTPVKEKIGEIARVLDVEENEYNTIRINAPKCVLTASFEIPDGFSIPDKNKIKAEAKGLGECFDLEESEISGRTITVRFSLKPGMTDFEKLYKAVSSTGTTSEQPGENWITLRISGLQINGENVHDLDILTIKGTVGGNFTATAVRGEKSKAQAPKMAFASVRMAAPEAQAAEQALSFDFTFDGQQSKGGKDMMGSDGITLSFRLNKPAQLVLPGDLTTEDANGMYDSRAIRDAVPGESLTFVGRLDVSGIKNQIQYMQGAAQEHKIRNVTSKFVTTLHLRNGILPDSDLDGITLTDNSLFKISDKAVNGSDVTITMELLTKDYSSFKKLQQDVQDVPDVLEIRVPAAVSGNPPVSGKILSAGTVSGEFHAEVVDDDSETVLAEPSYTWHSEQAVNSEKLGNGQNEDRDAEEGEITYTVRIPEANKLPADILINDDTENKSVYTAAVDEALTYKAKVDVTPVQQEMIEIENSFGVTSDEQFRNIELSGVSCRFRARLQVPEELWSVWPKEKGSYSLENPDGTPAGAFTITDVTTDQHTIVVYMGLNGFRDGNGTYDQLHKAVMEVTKQELILKVSSFRVPASIPRDQRISVYGTVNGSMQSRARKSVSPVNRLLRAAADAPEKIFTFAWSSTQMDGGSDAAYPDAAASSISATFQVPSSGEKQSDSTEGTSGQYQVSSPAAAVHRAATVKPAAPAAPVKATDQKAVSTGDNSKMMLDLVLLIASGTCLAAWAFLRRRKRHEQ